MYRIWIRPKKAAHIVQLAEHLTFNQRVRGSNPRWLTRHRPSGNGRPFALPVSRYGRGAASHLRAESGQMGDADAPPTPICSQSHPNERTLNPTRTYRSRRDPECFRGWRRLRNPTMPYQCVNKEWHSITGLPPGPAPRRKAGKKALLYSCARG